MNSKVFPIAQGGSAGRWLLGIVSLLVFGLGLFLGSLMMLGPRVVTMQVSTQGVQVGGDVYGRLIPRSALKTAEARVLDRKADPGYAPASRTNGIGLPNYQSGWFRLANGSKALLFVTDWSKATLVPTTEGYDLVVSPDDPNAFLAAVREPSAASSFGLSANTSMWASPLTWLLLGLSSLLPLGISVLLGYLAFSTSRTRFEVCNDGLRIRGDLFGRLIPRGTLQLADARIVNLKDDPELRPTMRTCGVGMPGYLSGWFRLKDRSRGLLFLTDLSRSLYLPTTGGYSLLISPDDPEGLLSALKA